MTRVIVCDDDEDRKRSAVDDLRAASAGLNGVEVEGVTSELFKEAILTMDQRRAAARGKAAPQAGGECVFDHADIAVLDYDLLELEIDITGESVAYLARCYSGCGLIVVINQDGPAHFDLTLRDRLDSFADLNISTRSLGNQGLWREPFSGYRPWAWPLLLEALAKWKQRLRFLDDHPLHEAKVLDVTGLRAVENALSRPALAFLEGVAEERDPTVEQFVRGSGHGLDFKDNTDAGGVARVAGARIARWMEILVAGPQDVVVDAPHLVARYPSLLGGTLTVDAANGTATIQGVPGTLHSLQPHLASQAGRWLSRPFWMIGTIQEDVALSALTDPSKQPEFGFVFCEDISRFLPRSFTRRFVADLPSTGAQRFVMDPSNLATPSDELARLLGLSDGKAVGEAFDDIGYAPQWRFSQ